MRYFPTVSLHFESQLPETFPFGLLSEAAAMLWALGGLKFFFIENFNKSNKTVFSSQLYFLLIIIKWTWKVSPKIHWQKWHSILWNKNIVVAVLHFLRSITLIRAKLCINSYGTHNSKFGGLKNSLWWSKLTVAHCLKITQNVAFEFRQFDIFYKFLSF